MIRTALLIASLFLAVHASRDPCQDAYHECQFRFRGIRGSVPSFSLSGPPNVPFTPRIISLARHEKLGILNTNGITVEALNRHDRFVSITNFGNPRFTPTHVKPLRIGRSTGSGLGHQTFTGDQQRLAMQGACVRIFFTNYQVLRDHRIVKKNLNDVMARRLNKCIVFRAV